MPVGNLVYSPSHVVLNPLLGPSTVGAGTPDAAPSSAVMGYGLVDPRVPYNELATGRVQGHFFSGPVKTCDQAPSAVATANIAANQHLTSGTAMTLVSTTGAGITVLATPFYCFGSGNSIPAGSLAIDGVPTYTSFGSGFVTNFYTPGGGIQRGISITAASGATGGAITIKGADYYGYPMTQTITTAAGTTANSLKTFKFIFSATPAFGDSSHNYSIGTADIYGFGLQVPVFADCRVFWNNVLQTFSTYTPPVTTAATATSGDVRGTFTPGTSSDGTIRVQMFVYPTVSEMATSPLTTGMYGVAQA